MRPKRTVSIVVTFAPRYRPFAMTAAAPGERDTPDHGVPTPTTRMDWRYLLPTLPDASGAVPAKSVVALDGSRLDLEHAAGRVADDGVVVLGIDRRRWRNVTLTPRRLMRSGDRLGLELAGVWLVAPTLTEARRFVPLDSAEALTWYLESLVIPGSITAATLVAIGRRLARRADRDAPSPFAPAYLACFVPRGASGAPAAIGALGDGVVGGARTVRDHRYLLVTSGQDPASRVVLLPFESGRPTPLAVVKIAADTAFNEDSEREHLRLGMLAASLPPTLTRSIPSPLGIGRFAGRVVTAQSAAPGQVLERSSGRFLVPTARKVRDLDRATDWITAFHHATTRRTVVWDEPLAQRALLDPLADLLTRWADATAPDELMTAARRASDRVLGSRIPICGQHFDFAPCNVFLDRSTPVVVDWEISEERAAEPDLGLPMRDLLFFVTYWYFLATRARTHVEETARIRDLLAADGRRHRLRDAAHAAVARYCSALAIDPTFASVAFQALWVERARYHERRVQRLGRPRDAGERTVVDCLDYLAITGLTRAGEGFEGAVELR
jgi:hypothetical protein